MDAVVVSQWPAWLRRRTAVEHLGPPNRFFPWLTIVLSLVTIVYVGGWNAAKYPVPLGYDAIANAQYMHVLLDQHHIPRPDQSGEANQPPAYYFVAGVAARAGHEVFGWLEARKFSAQLPEASYRGAQILNVVFVFLSALCVLWLARLVARDRPWVWAASVGFFAFLPVVSKTAAMIHPDNLNLLTGAAATASGTAIAMRRRLLPVPTAVFVTACGVGLAARASMIFVVLAVLVGGALALGQSILRRRRVRIAVAIGISVTLAAAAAVSYRQVQHHRIDRDARRGRFFDVSVPAVFHTPWRSSFKNEALAETYTEVWGDWFGAFAWSAFDPGPPPRVRSVLRDQALIGVLPTLLALGGWLGVGFWSRRRRELAIVALVPLIATGGYLLRSWIALTKDGDLFKASYLLNSAPVWALAFGLATSWLAARSRLGRYGMAILFAVFAVLELRFMLYGVRDGVPIF